MRRRNCILKTCIVVFALTTSVWSSPVYTLKDLGNLGGTDITVTGVNSTGQVTGFGLTSQGDYHAFLWSSGVMTDLGVYSTNSESQAGGINNSGVIAGTQTGSAGTQAGTWTGGVYTPVGNAGTSATGINDAGQVVGMYTTANGQGHAYRTSGASIQDLGTLAGGIWSAAYGINNSGAVTGYGMTSSGNFRGFVTDAAGKMTALSTLGGSNSYGMAINNTGQVAGSASVTSGYVHAAEWNNGSVIDLGTLGGGNSFAYGINSSAMIVGYSYLSNSQDSHAFVYRNGILYDLNALIPSAPGWTLLNAYSINDSGQIAGTGLFNGQQEAFLLTPQAQLGSLLAGPSQSSVPEPDTILYAGLGIALIVAYKLLSKRLARLRPRAVEVDAGEPE